MHEEALDLAIAVRHPKGESAIRNSLGEVYLELDYAQEAMRHSELALGIASSQVDPEEVAEAHFVVARALKRLVSA